MTKSRDLLKGGLIGVAIGFVVGLLLAPASGKDTQAKLRRKAKKVWGDVSDQATRMQQQLGTKVEQLKEVTKELSGQAKADSQVLIARAEAMKQDLRRSTKTLAEAGRAAKDETLASVRHMMDEGATLMNELEDVTKRLLAQAKTKLKSEDSASQEALARVEELEQNGHQAD